MNGITTKYVVDTNNLTGYAQVVEEIRNNQVVKAYTYGNDLISQRQVTNGNTVNFYGYDGHGSVRNLTDINGSVTDTYSYDAFGNIIGRVGTTENSYLYAGEQFDSDLGFYYNRARYLNIETGRFMNQDVYEGNHFEPKSLHKYTYVGNNPANKIDPSGYAEGTLSGQLVAVNVSGILNTLSTIRNIVIAAAITCALEATVTYEFDVDGVTPCGIKGPKKVFYRGTTFYDHLETVETQHIDWIRIMTNQTNYGFEQDRFGVYITSQYTTAQYYADLVGGGGRGGGPGIIVITVPENRWNRFTLLHGILTEVPVPTPPHPGQTETIIPFETIPEFESFATYL